LSFSDRFPFRIGYRLAPSLHDNNNASLFAILAEWPSATDIDVRLERRMFLQS